MTANSTIELRCPKCNERAMKVSANLDFDKPFTCNGCNAVVKIGELKTPSGDSLLDHTANIARDAFKGIKGFKPSR